jgi:hypothetical protein
MRWIATLITAIVSVLKELLGMDKPKEEEVIDEESPLPNPSVDDVFDDLGVRRPDAGSDRKD